MRKIIRSNGKKFGNTFNKVRKGLYPSITLGTDGELAKFRIDAETVRNVTNTFKNRVVAHTLHTKQLKIMKE